MKLKTTALMKSKLLSVGALITGIIMCMNEQPLDQDQRWWINVTGMILIVMSVLRLEALRNRKSDN